MLQALLSVIGGLPQGGRAHTSVLLPPPSWPEQDAPERAGEPASRLRLMFSPKFLVVRYPRLGTAAAAHAARAASDPVAEEHFVRTLPHFIISCWLASLHGE